MPNKENTVFESIRHVGEKGREFWFARDLQKILDANFVDFKQTLIMAAEQCKASGLDIAQHFLSGKRIIETGSIACEFDDIMLSRHACYMTVKNNDPFKKIVALGKAYYAKLSPAQEITNESLEDLEARKRLSLRKELIINNKSLASAAAHSGITASEAYSFFQNEGYKGLYGGLISADIRQHKGLKPKQNMLDFMGSTELVANISRTALASSEIKNTQMRRNCAEKANRIHYEAGIEVRKSIIAVGGTMPEYMPMRAKSINELTKEYKNH